MNNCKIFTLAPRESWVCDRFAAEWNLHNSETSAQSPYECDILWLLGSWCWNQIEYSKIRKNTKVCATIHHIVPEKFDDLSKQAWIKRDEIVDFYHVPCKNTMNQISDLTNKPIYVLPFWVNEKLWFNIDKRSSRSNIGIKDDRSVIVIGSFQRDTEGSDLKSPKLEKGPDIFFEAINQIKKSSEVHVLLGGWRRQYIINLLEREGINFSYIELPSFENLNYMYNACDLYIVGSRYEGGPQSVVECAATNTPIFSTDVGIASEILNSECIFDINNVKSILSCQSNTSYNFSRVEPYFIKNGGFNSFLKMFNKEAK